MNINRQNMIILVQDENEGVSEAAIFAALLVLLESIDEALVNISRIDENDAYIDIFQTVNKLRSNRMQMVQNFDEYQFLYKSTLYYAQNKIRYDNVLMSKLINRNHTNDTNIEFIRSERHECTKIAHEMHLNYYGLITQTLNESFIGCLFLECKK